MAAAFNTTVPELENELMGLILDGQIQARIDSHNKVRASRAELHMLVLYGNLGWNGFQISLAFPLPLFFTYIIEFWRCVLIN